MPSIKNIKPPTEERKHGIIYRFELLEEKIRANEMLKKDKALHKPVYFLDKNTHTGETIKRLVHA